jgi:hypothetical protein
MNAVALVVKTDVGIFGKSEFFNSFLPLVLGPFCEPRGPIFFPSGGRNPYIYIEKPAH